jgi:MinD-like ATPase involved in chromosome partitioning or flagellar assembly
MYCATFYSYKGGVGRTLALANVAAFLATRGKKVLIVDFDLEAPGITTLDICADARGKPGVVEYIHEYLRDEIAPQVGKYIHTCTFSAGSDESLYQIDVMPAGDQTSSYGADFAKIDWRELYDDRDGFLLMEDLREQWVNLKYDYVLIDSRTGLTDVSGICTRQLPDGVVTIFFPNEQNLVGLKDMVRSIRESSARPRSPELLFVASRIPRLDDENGVLERWLERFKQELAYSRQQFCSLDQYDSLALLDQDIFVLSRPKTGLSKQYRRLSGLLSQMNDEDAQGALGYIKTIGQIYSGKVGDPSTLHDTSNPFGVARHSDRLRQIEDLHQDDYVIQRHLAEHYYNLRDFAHLEVVLRHGLAAHNTQIDDNPTPDTLARLNQLQMRMSAETGETENAASSAISLLECAGATERMVVEALMVLVTAAPAALPQANDIRYLREADLSTIISLMNKFGISSREADYNCQIALYAVDRFGDKIEEQYRTIIELALIAGGEFERALGMLGDSSDPADIDALEVPDAFNRAMALWGRDGCPSRLFFEALLPKALVEEKQYGELANYQQCLGLIYAVLNNVGECQRHIERAISLLAEGSGRREVSCWSFVEEPAEDFLRHCTAIVDLSKGSSAAPLFTEKGRPRRAIH